MKNDLQSEFLNQWHDGMSSVLTTRLLLHANLYFLISSNFFYTKNLPLEMTHECI